MSGSATIPASISSCDAALSASLADNASAGAVIKAARTETITSALETIASSGKDLYGSDGGPATFDEAIQQAAAGIKKPGRKTPRRIMKN